MRRWGLRILVCALLGLATTVAVAWALAAFLPLRHLSEQSRHGACVGLDPFRGTRFQQSASSLLASDGRTVGVWEYTRPGMNRRYWLIHPSAGEGYRGSIGLSLGVVTDWTYQSASIDPLLPEWGALAQTMADPSYIRRECVEDARGWPRLALWCTFDGWLAFLRPPEIVPAGGGILLTPPHSDPESARALPYLPIWRGIAIDSAVYGAAWLVALTALGFGFTHARALIRRRYCLCPKCSYNLSGLPAGAPCPECGKGVAA